MRRPAQRGAAAGGRPRKPPWSRIPIGSARLINNPAANWFYTAEPEANTNAAGCRCRVVELLGGSSSSTAWRSCVAKHRTSTPGRRWATAAGATRRSCPSLGGWNVTRGRRRVVSRPADGPQRVTNPEPRDPIFAALIKGRVRWDPAQPRLQRRAQRHRHEPGDDRARVAE